MRGVRPLRPRTATFARWSAAQLVPRLVELDGRSWEAFPSGAYVGNEWFVTGLLLTRSSSGGIYPLAHALPLFDPVPQLATAARPIGLGWRLGFVNAMPTSIEDALPAEEAVQGWRDRDGERVMGFSSPEAVLEEIARRRADGRNPLTHAILAAGCHVLLGDMEAARREAARPRGEYEDRHGESLDQLTSVLEQGRDAAVAHLQAVRDHQWELHLRT